MGENRPKTLGGRIKLLRKSQGLSLRKVEQWTGISNAYLSQLERGLVKDPSVYKIETLAKLFNLTVDDLIHKECDLVDS